MIHLSGLLKQFAPAAQLLRSWPLVGGVSAQVTALEILQQGQKRRLVIRQYGPRDLQWSPDVAAAEFKLLEYLHSAGLPVPKPIYHESGMIVLDFVEGQNGVEMVPAPLPLARFLVQLHALDAAGLSLRPLPEIGLAPTVLDESLSESRIRGALEAFGSVPHPHKPALLHGDFWPGNTLWHAGQLAAVIDWEDAALGDPLADVGNARLELLFFAGPDAMQILTTEYQRLSGADCSLLPYWDLRAALRPCGRMHTWGLAPALETTMRERHRWFVEQAIT